MTNIKMMTPLILFFLFGASCCANLSSSELKSTKAKDLMITAWVEEVNGEDQVSVNSLLKTIPDEVGIQFNQGETLTVTAETESGSLQPQTNLSYDSNVFNLGEEYVAQIDKAPVGKNYILTYQDADGEETSASFSSKGVADLIAPADGQSLILGRETVLTWEDGNFPDLEVEVEFRTADGGFENAYFTVGEDKGEYILDLGHEFFDDAAEGEATVILENTTTTTKADGFGAASLRVVSESRRSVVLSRE